MYFPKMTMLYENAFSKNDKVVSESIFQKWQGYMIIYFPKMTKLYENTFSKNDNVI